jgi:hypothetical protein
MTRRFTVSIDRLVLRGVDPADRRAFVAGLETELARVLKEQAVQTGWVAGPRTVPTLHLGPVPMQPGLVGAHSLGAHVALSLGRGIKR